MKKSLLPYYIFPILFICFLINSSKSFCQTATFTARTTAAYGVAQSVNPLYYSQTGIVLYGFTLQLTAPGATINAFHLSGTGANGYFTNGKLYVASNTGAFSTAILVAGATVSFTSSGADITGLSQVYLGAVTKTFYLTADFSLATGTLPGSIVFGLSTTQSAVSSTRTNFADGTGNLGNTLSLLSQPAVTIVNRTGGLSTTTLTAGQTAIAMFGFSITVTGQLTISNFNIGSTNAGTQGYFTNGKLYSCTSATFSLASSTQVGTVTFSGNYANVSGLSELFTSNTGQTNNYFLVADYTVYTGTAPGTIQFNFTSGQSQNEVIGTVPTNSSAVANYNAITPTVTPLIYTIKSTITIAKLTLGLSATTIIPGQTGIAMFGFSVNTVVAITINNFNINSSNANTPGYFTNGKLYNCTSSTFSLASSTQVGTVAFSGNYANVSSLTESFTGGQTKYYFLVADYTVYTGTTPGTVIFNFTSGQSQGQVLGLTTYNAAVITGSTYTIKSTAITLANTTGGIAAVNLIPGQTTLALLGFQVAVKGTSTIGQFNIYSSNANLQGYFGNGKLYRSTSSTFSLTNATATLIAGSTVAGTAVTITGNYVNINGLSESYTSATGASVSHYYYLVADYSVYTGAPGTLQFQCTTTQSPSAVIQTSPVSASFNPTAINGRIFNVGTIITVAAARPAGATLISGQVSVPMFGIKMTVKGVSTIAQININSTNYLGLPLSTYFSNGRLYRSTSATFSLTNGTATLIAGSTVAGTSVTFNSTYVNISGLTEAFSSVAGQSNYYYFIADFPYAGANSDYEVFNFASGQSTSALVQSSPSAVNYNTYPVTESTYIIGTHITINWTGGTSTNWNATGNWSPANIPRNVDIAQFGVSSAFTNQPSVPASTTVTAASILIGNMGGKAVTITVNSASTLAVTGDVTIQSDNNSITTPYVHTFAGAGTLSANNLDVIASTSLSGSYTETLSTSVTKLNITNLELTSGPGNSTINITGGTTNISGTIQTTNTAGYTSTVNVNPTTSAILQLSNANALSGLSGTGTNVVTFNNPGATIEYSGLAQTVYTDGSITGLPAGVNYQNIAFSGSGIKTAASGNLTIAGNFTNNLANDAANYVDLITPSVNFSGPTQSLAGGTGNGTTLYNVNFSGTGTKTLASGNFYVSSTGILTMSGSSALAAGGLLTLNSDINGAATVAALLIGSSITGNVNVQRYISGGNSTYRGYRLLSSPVYQGTQSGNNVYNINYIQSSSLVTGSTGVAGGFDKAGNPSLFLYRDDLAPSNVSFTSGNFWGLSQINNAPNYNYFVNGGSTIYNIPVGNGFLYFFRGDRVSNLVNKYTPGTSAESVTFTETGTLNTGQITVNEWFNPTSANLDYTSVAGNSTVLGFALVGNPYPGSIDWDQYNTSTSTLGIYAPNVTNIIYIFDPVSQNYNTYQAGNGGVGTIVGSGSNIIPSGQGFFVQASNSSAQLIFNESAKTNVQANAATGNLLLGKPVQAAMSQYLRLRLLQDSVHTDGILIKFNSSAKPQYDVNEDALYKPGKGPVSLFSFSADSVGLAINTLPLQRQTQTTIGLNVSATVSGTYQLNLNTVKRVPELFDIWLMDAYRKDSTDIRHNPTYSFDIYKNDAASYGAKRFYLVIRQNSVLQVHLINFTAVKTTGGTQVVWKTENEQNYTYFTVERSTDNGTTFQVLGGFTAYAAGTYNLLDKDPFPLGASKATDKYRLKLEDLNGGVSYSNVVTLTYSLSSGDIANSNIIVYPNPATSVINVTINPNTVSLSSNLSALQALSVTPGINTTKGSPVYGIKIININGTAINTAISSSAYWQAGVSNLSPGTYIIQVVNKNNNSLVGKTTFIKL